MKYIVLEIQKNPGGAVGTLVSAYDTRNEAESHFHTVLAAAALSSLPRHAAVLVTEEGFLLTQGCYQHEAGEAEETA